MVEIVLFHHVGGLTSGVVGFAERLRDAGHVVHTPDLFGNRTFAELEDGIAYVHSVGEEMFAARAAEVVAPMAHDLVYGGMSMGAARAGEQVLGRPGARAAFFLYGTIAPSWWKATWPVGVPSQAHVTEGDSFRELDAEGEYVAEVAGGELFIYPGSGHLFAEPDYPDFDEEIAMLATDRILAFLGKL